MQNGRIQFITDRKDNIELEEQVELVCRGGIKWIQFRLKNTSLEEKLLEGEKIAKICKKYNATLIVNDDVELALKLKADGVHLGLSDMNPIEARKLLGEKTIIGATCNTFEDVCLRHKQNVDYIGLGPLRYTTTKKKLSPVIGINGYKNIIQKCINKRINTPIVAIGGIIADDFQNIQKTGVHGIAISSLITSSDNIEQKSKDIYYSFYNIELK